MSKDSLDLDLIHEEGVTPKPKHESSMPQTADRAPKAQRPRGKIVMHYFPFPAMGEPVRLLLELGGFDWEDKRVSFAEWKEGTLKKQATWGQMPFCLMADGTQLTQSRAMTKYFAHFVDINGTCLFPSDPLLAFRVDELVDSLEDLLNKLRKSFAIADPKEKSDAREKLFAAGGECTQLLTKMEGVCGDRFLCGNQFTYGDLYFYVIVSFLQCGFWQDPAPGFSVDFIDAYPKLKGAVSRFGALPKVKSYYSKVHGETKSPFYASMAK